MVLIVLIMVGITDKMQLLTVKETSRLFALLVFPFSNKKKTKNCKLMMNLTDKARN